MLKVEAYMLLVRTETPQIKKKFKKNFLPFSAGLIHANHGLAIMDYLSQELRTNNNEVCSVSSQSCDLNVIIM